MQAHSYHGSNLLHERKSDFFWSNLQACLGIFMVNSGLEEKGDRTEVPRVSQYRWVSCFM